MSDEQTEEWDFRLAVCPHCGAAYPDFHSPVGTLGTLCDNCGWSSEEAE